MDPVYFSTIEFQERLIYRKLLSTLHLNLDEGEIIYQRYRWNRNMPSVTGIETMQFIGKERSFEVNAPGKIIRNERTAFKPVMVKEEEYEQEVIFNYGVKLREEQKAALLKYCNDLDFEPYRNREMQMGEPGYIGYRDEVKIKFIGITNSYIPKMEWDMDYYYDEEHVWPSEKLYRYLLSQPYLINKKTRGWISGYGAFSLPI